jgi:hypothetical protein
MTLAILETYFLKFATNLISKKQGLGQLSKIGAIV